MKKTYFLSDEFPSILFFNPTFPRPYPSRLFSALYDHNTFDLHRRAAAAVHQPVRRNELVVVVVVVVADGRAKGRRTAGAGTAGGVELGEENASRDEQQQRGRERRRAGETDQNGTVDDATADVDQGYRDRQSTSDQSGGDEPVAAATAAGDRLQ